MECAELRFRQTWAKLLIAGESCSRKVEEGRSHMLLDTNLRAAKFSPAKWIPRLTRLLLANHIRALVSAVAAAATYLCIFELTAR